jgi:hypothetical protein
MGCLSVRNGSGSAQTWMSVSPCPEAVNQRDPRGFTPLHRAAYLAQYDGHGRTLLDYSAQLEPFLTQNHALHTLDNPFDPRNTPETTPNCTSYHTEGA